MTLNLNLILTGLQLVLIILLVLSIRDSRQATRRRAQALDDLIADVKRLIDQE